MHTRRHLIMPVPVNISLVFLTLHSFFSFFLSFILTERSSQSGNEGTEENGLFDRTPSFLQFSILLHHFSITLLSSSLFFQVVFQPSFPLLFSPSLPPFLCWQIPLGETSADWLLHWNGATHLPTLLNNCWKRSILRCINIRTTCV